MGREQKLIDTCFQIGLMIKSEKSFRKMSTGEAAVWIAQQLKQAGFPTTPSGASWGVLIDDRSGNS